MNKLNKLFTSNTILYAQDLNSISSKVDEIIDHLDNSAITNNTEYTMSDGVIKIPGIGTYTISTLGEYSNKMIAFAEESFTFKTYSYCLVFDENDVRLFTAQEFDAANYHISANTHTNSILLSDTGKEKYKTITGKSYNGSISDARTVYDSQNYAVAVCEEVNCTNKTASAYKYVGRPIIIPTPRKEYLGKSITINIDVMPADNYLLKSNRKAVNGFYPTVNGKLVEQASLFYLVCDDFDICKEHFMNPSTIMGAHGELFPCGKAYIGGLTAVSDPLYDDTYADSLMDLNPGNYALIKYGKGTITITCKIREGKYVWSGCELISDSSYQIRNAPQYQYPIITTDVQQIQNTGVDTYVSQDSLIQEFMKRADKYGYRHVFFNQISYVFYADGICGGVDNYPLFGSSGTIAEVGVGYGPTSPKPYLTTGDIDITNRYHITRYKPNAGVKLWVDKEIQIFLYNVGEYGQFNSGNHANALCKNHRIQKSTFDVTIDNSFTGRLTLSGNDKMGTDRNNYIDGFTDPTQVTMTVETPTATKLKQIASLAPTNVGYTHTTRYYDPYDPINQDCINMGGGDAGILNDLFTSDQYSLKYKQGENPYTISDSTIPNCKLLTIKFPNSEDIIGKFVKINVNITYNDEDGLLNSFKYCLYTGFLS